LTSAPASIAACALITFASFDNRTLDENSSASLISVALRCRVPAAFALTRFFFLLFGIIVNTSVFDGRG
jgi:hypothetical protein